MIRSHRGASVVVSIGKQLEVRSYSDDTAPQRTQEELQLVRAIWMTGGGTA